VDRLISEARAQARVSHPCVCEVYEVGEVEGEVYIAMQFIDGEALGAFEGRAPPRSRPDMAYSVEAEPFESSTMCHHTMCHRKSRDRHVCVT
jgi:hypothetical protein